MAFVIGRRDTASGDTGELGRYRALDGSSGATLHLDLDGPHAVLVVGKRGYGKSYTLGVIAEELARSRPVAPVVVDPMGVFRSLADTSSGGVPAEVVDSPVVAPATLDPRSWCDLVGLSPESGPGGLVWRAARRASTIDGMARSIREHATPGPDRRAALNHVGLADEWGIFDEQGLDAASLGGPGVTVLDVSRLDAAPTNAVVHGVGEALYRARLTGDLSRLPWLLVDEAHTVFEGVAGDTVRRILTRGRAPGVSIALATQRPSAIPAVGISQMDLLCAHRLTARRDIEALREARPTYMDESLEDRMPTAPGEALIVDDTTETVHTVQIRRRETPHGGDSPSASDVTLGPNPDDGTDTRSGV
jgi:hypothetical protein